MALSGGTRLGPYEVLGPIGAGGMGEVYRARDTRLGRDVAVKVLPGAVSHTPERLHRFEQEARLAGSLSHPSVLTVFDVGSHEGAPYIVTELLEGRSLREVLAAGPLPPRKAVEYAQQAALGLAAAHERGVVHRDLKPANLFVTKDGRLKVLDFGLAKLTQVDPLDVADSQLSTDTAEGKVVGTIGYMSPEQVRGHAVDARSDAFALGAVLYEMLSGRRAFTGDTAADTMTAILTLDPEDLSRPGLVVPASLDRIVRRCLEKDPAERFQSAKDIAFALEAESGTARSGTEAPAVAARPRRRLVVTAAVGLGLLLGGVTLGLIFGRKLWERPVPRFTQLTFRRGVVEPARFTVDGNTVVYSAYWDGKPPEIFAQRLDGSEAAPLGLPPSRLLAVSAQGELAILLVPPGEHGTPASGTLARAPLSGGAPRLVLDGVRNADWSPDGREIAALRWSAGQYQLEYPIGNVILRRPLSLLSEGRVRVSPRGDRVAMIDLDNTRLVLVDRAGRKATVNVGLPLQGFAWALDGESFLVTAGESSMQRTLRRVTLDGKVTEVYAVAGTLVLEDVARDGRVLIHHGFERIGARARAPGDVEEREVGVFAWSEVADLSADGTQVLLTDHGAGVRGSAFLRPTSGGPAVRLGEGWGLGLSADARWALVGLSDAELRAGFDKLILVPTGAGEPIPVPTGPLEQIASAWHVSADRVGLMATEAGRPRRAFVIELPSGRVRAVTPEGTQALPGLLPDGSVLGLSDGNALAFFPVIGGRVRELPYLLPSPACCPRPLLLRVSGDGRFLFVREGIAPGRTARIELATGRRVPWKVFVPGDPAGVAHIRDIRLTPDGEGYAYGYGRYLQDLYLVEGLRY